MEDQQSAAALLWQAGSGAAASERFDLAAVPLQVRHHPMSALDFR